MVDIRQRLTQPVVYLGMNYLIPSKKQFVKWSLPSKYTIIGTAIALISLALSILFYVFPNFESGEVTIDQFEAFLLKRRNDLKIELALTEEKEKRRFLEIQLNEVQKKLTNLEKSYSEEKQRLEEAAVALEKLKSELPENQIEKAKSQLRLGKKDVAESIFDKIVKKASGSVALAAYQSGRLSESRIDYKKAMAQYAKAITLDEDNSDYLLAAGVMAGMLGDYTNARLWLEKLTKDRHHESHECWKLAQAQHELAIIYKDIGQFEKAESLYQKSLEITEKSLGDQNINVAFSLASLGNLYLLQKKYKKAEPLYRRALTIVEKERGKDHPSIADILNSQGELYRLEGNYEKAESLYLRSMEISNKSLGGESPATANALHNLGVMYSDMGDNKKAEHYYERALEILKLTFGQEHPKVAFGLNNLALLYKDTRQYEKAELLFQKSFNIAGKKLGKYHQIVVCIMYNKANLYEEMKKYESARELYRLIEVILISEFPNGHPDIYFDDVEMKCEAMTFYIENAKIVNDSGSALESRQY